MQLLQALLLIPDKQVHGCTTDLQQATDLRGTTLTNRPRGIKDSRQHQQLRARNLQIRE
jgi:hypothetical protein